MRLYKLSDKFVSFLTETTAGYLQPEQYDEFIKIVENEISRHYFTYSSEGNLQRIINSMYDKTAFLHGCIKYPYYIEILILIAVNSNYLSDILIRNPEYFYWIVNPSNLNYKLEESSFEESVTASVNSYKNFETKVNSLRRIKKKELLRIALNDFLGNRSLEETTASLSILAKVLSRILFELCYKDVLLKNSITKIDRTYCLAALGKLGGNELNYSSDIDLILFFDKNVTLRNKDYFEIISEAAKLFIEKGSTMTDSGYLFRIDFRLRPDGRNSFLCRTIQDYLAYYESRGEDWERQMLIKSSFCGGDHELYTKFINYLRPFIYPSSFVNSPFEQIIKLKNNIEKNVTDENIKLFSGGIRDIEFAVQALQLINGGNNPELRTGTTIKAILSLEKAGLLKKKESATFLEAYTTYRKIEHFLQLMNDKQTHTIPEEGEELEQLSFFLGYNSSGEFKNHVAVLRKKVRNIFRSIIGLETTQENFLEIKFENRKKAENDLMYLRTGKGLLAEKTFDKTIIDSFSDIEEELLFYLKTSPDPNRTLTNFVRVLRNVNFPGQWYNVFNERQFFNNFLDLCTYSQRSIDLFAEDAGLRDFFISKKVLEKLNPSKLKSYSLKQIILVLASQYVLKIINDEVVSITLSKYLITRIDELTKSENIKQSFIIAGAGSLGNSEMNFSSDIDLLFICKEEKDLPDLQKIFQKLLNRIKEELKPFEADCRLRPEGKSSYLVWSIESQSKYILTRARIWELQSFSKLKFISGDIVLFKQINKSILTRLKMETSQNIKREILEMRKKLSFQTMPNKDLINLKKDKGGFLDIEFMIQFLLLKKPEVYKKLQGKRSSVLFSSLNTEYNNDEFNILDNNYHFMKKLLLANQCIFNSSGYKISLGKSTIDMLSPLIKTEESIKEKLSEILKINILMFNKYMDM